MSRVSLWVGLKNTNNSLRTKKKLNFYLCAYDF